MGSTLYVVEIQSWDWHLHVGVRPRSPVAEPAVEDDLLCSQAIAIGGLVLAPERHRAKPIHLSLYPLPREIILGDRDERDVGSLYKDPGARKGVGFSANLLLPADTLQNAIFCLGSIWRRVHMWVDDDAEPASITDFGFSADAEVPGAVDEA